MRGAPMMTPEERTAAWTRLLSRQGERGHAREVRADHEALAAEVTRLQAEVERLSAPVTDDEAREALERVRSLEKRPGELEHFGCLLSDLATLTRKLDQQARIIEAANDSLDAIKALIDAAFRRNREVPWSRVLDIIALHEKERSDAL